MTSRDPTASYYDLELPDGTRTEVWSVLRAVLTVEEALGYAKGCLLTRIMRDGRKDTDRQREAEKVGIEAGMLAEAMEAYLSSVDAVADRECERFIAELERERDEARQVAQETLMQSQSWQLRHREAEAERDRWRASFDRAEADLMSLRKALDTERQAAVATAEELERVREKLKQVKEWRATWRDSCNNARKDADALRRELAALRDRYRPRRQSEEPAPKGLRVLMYDSEYGYWRPTSGTMRDTGWWVHQPPAPEGE